MRCEPYSELDRVSESRDMLTQRVLRVPCSVHYLPRNTQYETRNTATKRISRYSTTEV
jgi:hypothetical protein